MRVDGSMSRAYVIFKFAKNIYGGTDIDTTSKSGDYSGLSPFLLDATKYGSKNFENLWQFSKVYPGFAGQGNFPSSKFLAWREKGFEDPIARRYPMGKGAKPLYSIWWNPKTLKWEKLDYISARKTIYVPLYA